MKKIVMVLALVLMVFSLTQSNNIHLLEQNIEVDFGSSGNPEPVEA